MLLGLSQYFRWGFVPSGNHYKEWSNIEKPFSPVFRIAHSKLPYYDKWGCSNRAYHKSGPAIGILQSNEGLQKK